MKLNRRTLLSLGASAATAFVAARAAQAQSYPTRPVRLVVPFPPGGVVDLYGRLIGQKLSERLGQPFIIENRPGAGGNIGTESVVRAMPDGYTLLMLTSTNSWNVPIYEKLTFDFIRDIRPIATIYYSGGILVANPSFPAKSVLELISYAKENPGKINMPSGGIGSAQHVWGELFKSMTGVDMQHVPYRGGGPALIDVLAGQMPLMFETFATSISQVQTGKLRAIAVTAATRAPLLPDVPTIAESVPGYDAWGWQGVGAPKNTSPEIIEKLNREINEVLSDSEMKARTAELGGTIIQMNPTETAKFIASYTEKWVTIIRAAGIKME
jgi:tripartite-type tricarboxylate transporter receptor subunit TctC